MIYSDGLLIFFFTKLREQLKYEREKARQINEENISSSNVFLTNNQVLGFLILAIANLMSSILLLNVGNIFLIGYLCLSLFEHIILESSNRKS